MTLPPLNTSSRIAARSGLLTSLALVASTVAVSAQAAAPGAQLAAVDQGPGRATLLRLTDIGEGLGYTISSAVSGFAGNRGYTQLQARFLASASPARQPQPAAQVAPDVQALFDQPLAPFVDVCDASGDARVRRVRSATLGAAGNVEDRLEVRTTTRGLASAIEYIVNDVVMFSHPPDHDPELTTTGLALVSDRSPAGAARAAKVLAAFAAMHSRTFAVDADTDTACGATRDKAKELLKCGAVGLAGCCCLSLPTGGVSCVVAAGAALLCSYAVEKACDAEPDTCQPGWTEG